MKPMIVLALVFLPAALMGFQAACATKVYSIPELYEEISEVFGDDLPSGLRTGVEIDHFGTEYSWRGRIRDDGTDTLRIAMEEYSQNIQVAGWQELNPKVIVFCDLKPEMNPDTFDPETDVDFLEALEIVETLSEGDEVVLRGKYLSSRYRPAEEAFRSFPATEARVVIEFIACEVVEIVER